MEDMKSLEKMLRKIKGLSSVIDAVLMTKTGMIVLGSVRRSLSLEKFVGVSALLMGSAEAASFELKDSIIGVVVRTKNTNIAITNVTENILLAVTFLGKQHDKVLEELRQIIKAR